MVCSNAKAEMHCNSRLTNQGDQEKAVWISWHSSKVGLRDDNRVLYQQANLDPQGEAA